MKKNHKVLSAVAAGVLGIMGAAYAVNLSTAAENDIDGNLDVEGGSLDVGVVGATAGVLTLHSSSGNESSLVLKNGFGDWNLANPNGNIWLTNNHADDFSVNIKNLNATGGSHLTLHDGDLTVRDGNFAMGNGTAAQDYYLAKDGNNLKIETNPADDAVTEIVHTRSATPEEYRHSLKIERGYLFLNNGSLHLYEGNQYFRTGESNDSHMFFGNSSTYNLAGLSFTDSTTDNLGLWSTGSIDVSNDQDGGLFVEEDAEGQIIAEFDGDVVIQLGS